MKKIKIKVIGFTRIEYSQDGYFLNYLKNDSKFEIVEENQDLIVANIFCYEQIKNDYLNSKVLIFSGENLYYSSDSFAPFGLGILRKFNLHNSFLKNYLPQKKIVHQPRLYISEELNKNHNFFWILCNENKAKNILNFPYFFDTHLGKIQDLIDIKKKKLYTKKKKFCAFVVANPNAKDRINLFHQLSKYKKVDSFGPVLNNAKVPMELLKKYKFEDISIEDAMNTLQYSTVSNAYQLNQELFQDYKFVICFENTYHNDYITEKLPNVMMSNTIALYRGAKNINEFFNTKSFINYDDYGSYDTMIQKIIELDQDDKKYQKMLEEPFFPNNELPPRVKNAKQDLEKFLLKMVGI